MLKTAELIKEVAKQSGYNLYEVEDFVNALSRVIVENMLKGKSIKLEHLFVISPKINPPRNYMDAHAKQRKISVGSVSAKIKLATYLKDKLNEKNTSNA